MAEARPTPASSSVAPGAAPRSLPPTLLLPRTPNGSRGARGGGSAAGSRKRKAPVGSASGAEGTRHRQRHDRLLEAVRLVGRGVDPGVTGADILDLAMAKGPMFSWLTYWPEEGYPKEDQPY